jgi:hypothetical protein
MKKSLILCGILTVDSDTKLVKNAVNFQFAELRPFFAELPSAIAESTFYFAEFTPLFAEKTFH